MTRWSGAYNASTNSRCLWYKFRIPTARRKFTVRENQLVTVGQLAKHDRAQFLWHCLRGVRNQELVELNGGEYGYIALAQFLGYRNQSTFPVRSASVSECGDHIRIVASFQPSPGDFVTTTLFTNLTHLLLLHCPFFPSPSTPSSHVGFGFWLTLPVASRSPGSGVVFS